MEVYGEKPKKFTKEWWSYIWLYYKWHIISTIAAIAMIVSAINQCANRTVYDFQVTMVTEKEIVMSQKDAIEAFAESIIDDATGNGVNEVYVMPILLSGESNAEQIQAGYAQFTVEIAMPESYVFIMSEIYADRVAEYGILESVDEWAGEGVGEGCLVSLEGNEMLESLGIDTKGDRLYMGVVSLFGDRASSELEVKRHENGVRFARSLLGLE